jgi:hypothetical protein
MERFEELIRAVEMNIVARRSVLASARQNRATRFDVGARRYKSITPATTPYLKR